MKSKKLLYKIIRRTGDLTGVILLIAALLFALRA
jgi:hypothetical protein